MKNIAVIGTGYVGIVTGACLAQKSNKVICVDNDRDKIAGIKRGVMPIYELGLKELVLNNIANERIDFTTDIEMAVKFADVIFIAVGTPPDDSGHANLNYVYQAAREIAHHIDRDDKVIVMKSTVPVGTNDQIEKIMKMSRFATHVVSNPEFLREGVAIQDFMFPDRVVIGAENDFAFEVMCDVYTNIPAKIVRTNRRSAELAKYGANAFLSAKIAFINEMANLCEKTGANVEDVAIAIGLDHRIGSKFLKAGPGFGGSCFPKDILALVETARDHEAPFKLIETVIEINEDRKKQMAKKVEKVVGTLVGKQIAVLGLTFKPDTDDMRSSPSLTIISEMIEMGAGVKAYDPEGMENAKALLPDVDFHSCPYTCLTGADALVIITEWPEFAALDLNKVRNLMHDPIIIDLRNMFDPTTMRKLGFVYESIGR